MHRRPHTICISLSLLATLILVGCGANKSAGGTGSGGGSGSQATGLKITGLVDSEMSWTEDEIRAMDTVEAGSVNSNGEPQTYTGVALNGLLDMAGMQDGASMLVFIADDGTQGEVDLSDVRACSDCIVSFRNRGGFSMVLPGFPGNVQVKGVVEIHIQ